MNTGVASTERMFELGAGGIEILKDSFICLDDLREALGRLRLLRGRLNGIRTKMLGCIVALMTAGSLEFAS